jgi:hypothetical protein
LAEEEIFRSSTGLHFVQDNLGGNEPRFQGQKKGGKKKRKKKEKGGKRLGRAMNMHEPGSKMLVGAFLSIPRRI